MYKKILFTALLLFAGGTLAIGQALTWTPQFPTIDDTVTITYDASQGNGALNNIGPVYAHTGVLSNESTNPTDWRHIRVQWDQGADSAILLTQIAPNIHQMQIPVRAFYYIGNSEKVYEMMFVFRDSNGTFAGKNADGSDFSIPIFEGPGYDARFIAPLDRSAIVSVGDTVPIRVQGTTSGLLKIRQNGNLVTQSIGTTEGIDLIASGYGKNWITLEADGGATTVYDTIFYIVQPPVTIANPPSGTGNGINYLNDSTVRLTLQAPNKDFVYVIGDFNDWELEPAYLMNRSSDGTRHWMEISGLIPGKEYRFQYFVEKDVKVADPWADKTLDPNNDNGVSAAIYPNLIDYPYGKTTEILSVLQTAQQPYNWQVANFSLPDSRDLVIYELLVRDFVLRHDYKTVKDSLQHLIDLGVNAIELMPVMEFDGNRGWGYSPNFFFAPDKYYGPKDELKALIDECHANGIAVILDVVFNHTFGLSPMVRMYQDKVTYKTTPDNPWFNVDIPHPYGVGHDLDHASPYTQALVDTTLSYWVNEYKVDGFRLDLSKGFTNNVTGSDIGAWSAYDAPRVGYLKRIANVFWNRHPGKWLILEHFSDNTEETELANYGFMMWGKATTEYNQSSMAWTPNSDFSYGVSYQARGWNFHNLIGFMESHDEERLMYENLNFGNEIPGYSTRDLPVALDRMAQVAAFFFTVPGPKMMWQFGELGYDISINFNGRTGIKPIKWNYKTEPDRLRLFKKYRALINLKTNHTTFRSGSYDISAWGYTKQIHVNDPGMNVTVIGNFDVVDQWTYTGFQHTGTWYDYFTGNSLNVTDVNMNINLPPGEFRVFTDVPLPVPDVQVIVDAEIPEATTNFVEVHPNPFAETAWFSFNLDATETVEISIFNAIGQRVRRLQSGNMSAGFHQLKWDGRDDAGSSLPNGYYLWNVEKGGERQTGKLVLQR